MAGDFTPCNDDDDVTGWVIMCYIQSVSVNWNICYLNYSIAIIFLQDGS